MDKRTCCGGWGGLVHFEVLLPAMAGVLTTVVGVVLGGRLARRHQVEAWSRDRQVEACASIVRESTRMQLQHGRLKAGNAGSGEVLDWTPWNEALAVLHLVGHPEMVEAVLAMDEAFWISSDAVKHRHERVDEAWETLRDPLEATRLLFINTARHHLVAGKHPLSRLVARVPPAAGVRASPRLVPDPRNPGVEVS